MKMRLKSLLIKHEDYRMLPYPDILGNITIGIGRNLTGRGVLPTEIDMMFDHDVDYFVNFLSKHYSWFNELNETRQIALIDMCFAGTRTFSTFKKMINFLANKDYKKAADELLDSKYAQQVGERATELAEMIEHG